ncbi:MAG: flavodoxin [Thermoflexaceae bacterium]|nr:flavodoxin [Thermoflexaceae bacterium]
MIKIIYWTQTGNTEDMASEIAKGVEENGKEAILIPVSDARAEDLKDEKVFALGCPAMGAEELEESEMEPFVNEIESFVSGKTVGLFGSYGWGGGEWMQNWTERMTKAGAIVVNGEGVICQGGPDEEELKMCRELGKQLAMAQNTGI